MEEIHDAIQDAQYMGAVGDPLPRPTLPLVPQSDDQVEAILGEVERRHPTLFQFQTVLSKPLGYFLFAQFAVDRGEAAAIRFLEDVAAFRSTSFAIARLGRAERIARLYLGAPLPESVRGILSPPVGDPPLLRDENVVPGQPMEPSRARALTALVEAASRSCLGLIVDLTEATAARLTPVARLRPAHRAASAVSMAPPPSRAAPRGARHSAPPSHAAVAAASAASGGPGGSGAQAQSQAAASAASGGPGGSGAQAQGQAPPRMRHGAAQHRLLLPLAADKLAHVRTTLTRAQDAYGAWHRRARSLAIPGRGAGLDSGGGAARAAVAAGARRLPVSPSPAGAGGVARSAPSPASPLAARNSFRGGGGGGGGGAAEALPRRGSSLRAGADGVGGGGSAHKGSVVMNPLQGDAVEASGPRVGDAGGRAFALDDALFSDVVLDVLVHLRDALWEAFLASPRFAQLRRLRALQEVAADEPAFTVYRVLGRGAFGTVSACKKRNTGKMYARKVLSKRRVLDQRAATMVWTERNLLASVRSPFVLSLAYAYETEAEVVLVTDILTGGDLGFHLRQVGRFDEARARFHAAEILLGLQHLHSMNVIYRDLKPSNVLLSQPGHACITDLGLAAQVGRDGLSARCGTRGYWAPEVLMKDRRYGLAADWWSFGCLVAEMLLGRNPFRNVSRALSKEDRSAQIDHRTLTWDVTKLPMDQMSPEARDLCIALLHRDPEKRLGARGAREVMQHPWFRDMDWGLMAAMQLRPPFEPERDINAMNQEVIGTFRDAGRCDLTEAEQLRFHDWAYVSRDAVQREVVEFMVWQRLCNDALVPTSEDEPCCPCSVM